MKSGLPPAAARIPPLLTLLEPAARHGREQRLARRLGERVQDELGAALRRAFAQLRASHPHDEHGGVPQAFDQAEQEVEQRGLGPLGVVHDENERSDPGGRAEHLQEGPIGVLTRLAARKADRRGDAADGHR